VSGRDWRETFANLVPAVLWLVALAGMVAGVVVLVAWTIGG
jgi:hypothetical protein